MSVQALNWVLTLDELDDPGPKFVLMILANWCSADNECWPSRNAISRKTGIPIRSVQRYLTWLEENDYITRTRRRGESGRNRTTVYTLHKLGKPVNSLYGDEEEIETSRSQIDPKATLAYGRDPEAKLSENDRDPEATGSPLYTKELLNNNYNHNDNLSVYTKDKKSISKEIDEKGSEAVKIVLEKWRETFSPKAKLDRKRKRRIQSRLNEKFSVEDLLTVLKGVKKSPWHMGDNPDGIKYTAVETIFRDAAQVEKFIELAKTKRISRDRVVPNTKDENCVYCAPEKGVICQIHRRKNNEGAEILP